jgi:Flp pilus assembly protein TadD
MSAGDRRRWILALAAIAGLALALRALYLFQIYATVPTQVVLGDARQYDAWARQIVAGPWLGTAIFYQTPLYPYLLALVFAIAGHHLFLVRILQSIGGTLACVLLGLAGRRFVSVGAGLAAGVLLAVYPPAIFFDGLIQKASLDLFLMAAVLALLGEYLSRRTWPWIGAAGVAVALLMLNRENARVVVPIVAIWLLWFNRESRRTGLISLAAFLAGVAFATLPVAARNYSVGGEFLISTSQLGPSLYVGNHAGASGWYEPLVAGHGDASFEREDATQIAEAAAHRKLSPSEVSGYWIDRVLADIRRDPGWWLRLLAKKALLTLSAGEAADTESLDLYAQYSGLLRGLSWLTFGIVLPLAAFGAWMTRDRWRTLTILYALFAALVAATALFYIFARYRYPVVPLTLLCAGAGVVSLPELARRPSRAPAALGASALAALVAYAPAGTTYDTSFYNVALALDREGRPADAIPLLHQSVLVSPDDPKQDELLGRVLRETGDTGGAVAALADAVRLAPRDVEARNDYGKLLLDSGRPADAATELRVAEAIEPGNAAVHANLGLALSRTDDWSDAIVEDRASIALDSANADAHNDLGAALEHEGDAADAAQEFEATLALRPDDAQVESNLAVATGELHDAASARRHFEHAIQLQADRFEIRANYGDFLAQAGDLDDAIAQYTRVVELAPASVEMRYRLAALYARAGRIDDAAATLESARVLAVKQGDVEGGARIEAALKMLSRR